MKEEFFKVEIADKETKARAGVLKTTHGEVKTPVFMPVGTYGTVKGMMPKDIEEIGSDILLANAYHLLLRPGREVITQSGGLHRFMGWRGAILTDSGGFQIYSLNELRKVTEEGALFKSPVDGTEIFLSPEEATLFQLGLGADIIMGFDVCSGHDSAGEEIRDAMELTLRWMKRCKMSMPKGAEAVSRLFGITQGGTFEDLRRESTRRTIEIGFDGIALGGLSVGEKKEETAAMVDISTSMIPGEIPVYLMGVGTPEDIMESVSLGVDMFDCVLPTRNARNGLLYTSRGNLHIKNSPFKDDRSPVDPDCACYVCANFSRAYLRHLFNCQEILSSVLGTYHNLYYFINLMKGIRESIIHDRFLGFKKEFYSKLEV